MTKQEKSEWLAENLLKLRKFGPYWEGGDYRVLRGDRAESGWHPYQNIAQAELVLNALHAAGWWWNLHGNWKPGKIHAAFSRRDPDMFGEAFADTPAKAICEAAYNALKGDEECSLAE